MKIREQRASTGVRLVTRLNVRADQENKKAIVDLLERATGVKLLELGPGKDPVAIHAMNVGCVGQLYGLEYPGCGDAAAALGLEMRYCNMSVDVWPYPDAFFDVVVSNQVVEHIPNTDHFFKELHRVLRGGGYTIVSTPNLGSWESILWLIMTFQPRFCFVSDELYGLGNPFATKRGQKREDPVHGHLRIFTLRALADICSAYGLRVERLGCGSWMGLPVIGAWFARIDPWHGTYATVKARKH